MDSGLYPPVLGLLCGLVGFRIGWRIGRRSALPAVQTALGVVAFGSVWRSAGLLDATVAVAGWAVGTTLISLVTFHGRPARTDEVVLGARAYRDEMVAWLRGGRGFPTAVTARRHLWELAGYLAAAVATANVLALALGAVLLNKMNAWVAAVLRHARRPVAAALLAWNVWSVVRVASYVALGAACAVPLGRALGLPADPHEVRGLVTFGALGVVADLALKLALSGAAGRALAAAVDVERLGDAAIVERSHLPEIPHGSS